MLDGQVQARRAIEALRAGVPNRDAVNALGTAAVDVEERFRQLLAAAEESGIEPLSPAGFLLAGNFGSGKSHLLEYLQHVAREQRFVTSKIVISKETPLYDPAKLYRAAVRTAVVPGRRGAALAQVAGELDPYSTRYVDFYKWVQQPASGLNQRFAATLFLYERGADDPELRDRIISFWAGDPIQVGEIRRALRQLGERVTYALEPIDARSLALQRFRFAARLMLAAGYAGWVLLVDEVELIGRYTLHQRARSYAELARWTGNLKGEAFPGITAVCALTSDFEAAVLNDRNDREAVPGRLRASPREGDQLLAPQAERGMRLIGRAVKLAPPSRAVIDETYAQLRAIHGQAYGWEPPPVGSAARATSTSMREYVRWWITEWDLRRLYPDYAPAIEATPVGPTYAEDADLEAPSEPDTPPGESDR
ncbi:MAG TPA: BREX system ATP-binding domain-containing protein [Chloroflexota bacterium]|jgi:hypothetical protein